MHDRPPAPGFMPAMEARSGREFLFAASRDEVGGLRLRAFSATVADFKEEVLSYAPKFSPSARQAGKLVCLRGRALPASPQRRGHAAVAYALHRFHSGHLEQPTNARRLRDTQWYQLDGPGALAKSSGANLTRTVSSRMTPVHQGVAGRIRANWW